MCDKPDQFEIETRLADLATHGDISRIARNTGQHRSAVSRQFNPDEPSPHPIFAAMRELYGTRYKPELHQTECSMLVEYIAALNGREVGELTRDEAARQIKQIALGQMRGKTLDEQHELFTLLYRACDEALRESRAGKGVAADLQRTAGAGFGKSV